MFNFIHAWLVSWHSCSSLQLFFKSWASAQKLSTKTWHDFQWSLWQRLLFYTIIQFLLKLSHNCPIRCSVTEFIKSLYYYVMLIIDNSHIWTLKTITTDSNSPSFFLLIDSGYRHRRGHPTAFLILSYSDKGCGPTVHVLPLPINLQSFTTSRPERNERVGGTSGGKFHTVETFSFFTRSSD